jgi:biotin carboxyl carrier protein
MKSKIIIALLAVVTLMSCNNNKSKNSEPGEHTEKEGPEGVVLLNPQQREALDLELGTFQMRNLTTMVKTNGEMQVPPASSAEVTAVIGGNVRDIRVFHGDKVRRGQTLAILEHPDYIKLQEDFAELASRLEFLEMEYERQKELFENNVGAGREFQQVKSEYNSAKAKYQGLKARLQLLHLSPEKVKEGEISNSVPIVSPINGYVNEIDVKVGTYAGAQDMLFEITDNSEIHADFLVYWKKDKRYILPQPIFPIRSSRQRFLPSDRNLKPMPGPYTCMPVWMKPYRALFRACTFQATFLPMKIIPAHYPTTPLFPKEPNLIFSCWMKKPPKRNTGMRLTMLTKTNTRMMKHTQKKAMRSMPDMKKAHMKVRAMK